MKKLFVLPLILLLSVSCNELKQETAKRKSIVLQGTQQLPAGFKAKSSPDSVTAFLWPTEDFFKRQSEAGRISAASYQDYIANVARDVFYEGDVYDELSIESLKIKYEGLELKKKPEFKTYDNLASEEKTLNAAIASNERKIKSEQKKVEKEQKKIDKEKAKITSEKPKLEAEETNLTQLEERYSVENCQATPDTEDCKTLENIIIYSQNKIWAHHTIINSSQKKIDTAQKKITSSNAKIAKYQKKLDEANAKLPEVQSAMAQAKPAYDEIMQKLTALETKRTGFKEKALEQIRKIQATVDPQAASQSRNANGDLQTDIDISLQENWIDVESSGSRIYIKDGYFDIRFEDWGKNALQYKTRFKEDDEGNVLLNTDGSPVMAEDSDFSRMIFLGNNVYEFNMIEKNADETKTGRIIEFKVEMSPYYKDVKILGDMNIRENGQIVRRGQIKIIIPKSE